PLDIIDQVPRLRDRRLDDLDHLVLALPHLMREVNGRGGNEGVNARTPGVPYRFAGARDVGRYGACEAGDHGILHSPGDLGDGLEIALRGDREAGLDNVDAHRVEKIGDFELFLKRHSRAGTLLTVAERRVEDHDAVPVALRMRLFAHLV